VSYVRARAEGLGVTLTDGLFTRAERVVVMAIALIFGLLRPALWLLAILTVLTATQRLVLAYRKVSARSTPPAAGSPVPGEARHEDSGAR
jgi:CDP-diacylglycerol---glycerol-3-phosphate 3-phosphatidyltransferase